MNFKRGTDPLKSMSIGISQKRIFKDVEDAALWAILFPGEYTSGVVDDWFGIDPVRNIPFFNFYDGRFGVTTGKLQMVKWFKDNIKWEGYGISDTIGLRDAKMIADRIEELLTNMRISDVLEKGEITASEIMDYINSLSSVNSEVRDNLEGYRKEGFDIACSSIRRFILEKSGHE
jgi:hypothetical protein